MSDKFADRSTGLTSPLEDGAAVTPDDSNDLAMASRALFIGASGSLRVTMVGGTTLDFTSVPTGVLPLRVKRVHAAGTGASAIVALW